MNSRQLCVVHLPFAPDNPYQGLLADELRRLGIAVDGRILRWALVREVRGADVLHIHWTHRLARANLWKFAAGYACLAAQLVGLRIGGRRIIWTVHNLENHERQNRVRDWLVSFLMGQTANSVIVHDDSAGRAAVRRFGITPKKIAVVPQGHYIGCYPNSIGRVEARRELGLSERVPVFLFFGMVRPYKGVEELIATFRGIQEDAALFIAGRCLDSDFETRIRSVVREDSRITLLTDFIPSERVQVFMNAADAVVFPYRRITTSAAVVLAMSFGKACIAPRLDFIKGVLDEEGAFLYDPADRMGLAHALSAAMRERPKLDAMGRHNLTVAGRWSWKQSAAATAMLYRGRSSRASESAAADAAAHQDTILLDPEAR